jgi:hypothetical protein
MKRNLRLDAKSAVLALAAWIALGLTPAAASDWTGIDGSVANVNNLMAQATTAVQAGNYEEAKSQLAATARNLEAASSWAHFVWRERRTDPSYVPVALNPLPPELTESYYKDKMDASRDNYTQLLSDIQQARIELGLKQFQTLVSILTGAVNLSKGIVDTVKGNPLMAPKSHDRSARPVPVGLSGGAGSSFGLLGPQPGRPGPGADLDRSEGLEGGICSAA